jgi:hypothetical protein
VLQAAGFLMLGRITDGTTYVGGVLPAQILIGIGLGLLLAPAFSAGTDGVDRSTIGVASALVNMSQQLGSSLGAAFLTTYAAHFLAQYMAAGRHEDSARVLSYAAGFQITGVISAVATALLIAVLWSRRRDRHQEPGSEAAAASAVPGDSEVRG